MEKRKASKKIASRVRTTAVSAKEYAQTLVSIKQQIQAAQVKAALTVNKELIKLYWYIGKTIAEKQEISGWGAGVIEQLAKDLQSAFPGMGGFSRANIFYMRAFYLAYIKVQQPVGQFDELPVAALPWGQNVTLITKLKQNKERLWYAKKAIEHGWSRTILEMQIESNLYCRQGKAVTNFNKTLPATDSDMAQQTLKDPYVFDFLTLQAQHIESDLEQGLINHIQKFLLELGEGFAFIGRQHHLEVDEKNYYIDLLFYHVKLHCYVVIEIKAKEFDPRDTGQISFYLSAVDDTLKSKDDKPTIGILLCKSKRKLTVEYALRKNLNPIGVASYETKLVASLPKELKSSLPTIEEIEAELKKQEFLSKKKTSSRKIK